MKDFICYLAKDLVGVVNSHNVLVDCSESVCYVEVSVRGGVYALTT